MTIIIPKDIALVVPVLHNRRDGRWRRSRHQPLMVSDGTEPACEITSSALRNLTSPLLWRRCCSGCKPAKEERQRNHAQEHGRAEEDGSRGSKAVLQCPCQCWTRRVHDVMPS